MVAAQPEHQRLQRQPQQRHHSQRGLARQLAERIFHPVSDINLLLQSNCMATTNGEQQYTRKDLEKIIRECEPEVPLTLNYLYDNRCTFNGLASMLRQYSVDDA